MTAVLPKDNLAYPVHISVGQKSSGSGFFLNDDQSLFLVTAKHVLFRDGLELYEDKISISCLTKDVEATIGFEADARILFDSGKLRKHATADVAAIFVGTHGSGSARIDSSFTLTTPRLGQGILGLSIANTRRLSDVEVANEVILFGYPGKSLGSKGQIDGSRPLLRKGIVAGKTQDNRVVVDVPTYFGSSGALVVEIDQQDAFTFNFRGIGVATEMVPFVEETWSRQYNTQTGTRFENSGYTIVEPMDRVLELIATW